MPLLRFILLALIFLPPLIYCVIFKWLAKAPQAAEDILVPVVIAFSVWIGLLSAAAQLIGTNLREIWKASRSVRWSVKIESSLIQRLLSRILNIDYKRASRELIPSAIRGLHLLGWCLFRPSQLERYLDTDDRRELISRLGRISVATLILFLLISLLFLQGIPPVKVFTVFLVVTLVVGYVAGWASRASLAFAVSAAVFTLCFLLGGPIDKLSGAFAKVISSLNSSLQSYEMRSVIGVGAFLGIYIGGLLGLGRGAKQPSWRYVMVAAFIIGMFAGFSESSEETVDMTERAAAYLAFPWGPFIVERVRAITPILIDTKAEIVAWISGTTYGVIAFICAAVVYEGGLQYLFEILILVWQMANAKLRPAFAEQAYRQSPFVWDEWRAFPLPFFDWFTQLVTGSNFDNTLTFLWDVANRTCQREQALSSLSKFIKGETDKAFYTLHRLVWFHEQEAAKGMAYDASLRYRNRIRNNQQKMLKDLAAHFTDPMEKSLVNGFVKMQSLDLHSETARGESLDEILKSFAPYGHEGDGQFTYNFYRFVKDAFTCRNLKQIIEQEPSLAFLVSVPRTLCDFSHEREVLQKLLEVAQNVRQYFSEVAYNHRSSSLARLAALIILSEALAESYMPSVNIKSLHAVIAHWRHLIGMEAQAVLLPESSQPAA